MLKIETNVKFSDLFCTNNFVIKNQNQALRDFFLNILLNEFFLHCIALNLKTIVLIQYFSSSKAMTLKNIIFSQNSNYFLAVFLQPVVRSTN